MSPLSPTGFLRCLMAGYAAGRCRGGGPKVDLALEPNLALNLVDACAMGHAEARDIQKAPKDSRSLFAASGFDVGRNDQRGIIGLTVTFGMGGQLSFALDDAMANSLFETLGELTGGLFPHPRHVPTSTSS